MSNNNIKLNILKQINNLNNVNKFNQNKINKEEFITTLHDLQGGEEELGNTLSMFLPEKYITYKMFSIAWDERIKYRKKLNYENKKNYI